MIFFISVCLVCKRQVTTDKLTTQLVTYMGVGGEVVRGRGRGCSKENCR